MRGICQLNQVIIAFILLSASFSLPLSSASDPMPSETTQSIGQNPVTLPKLFYISSKSR